MPDVLLVLHCAVRDTDAIVEALRPACPSPLHVQSETVRGRDFSDAVTAEKVSGELRRTRLEVVVDDRLVADLVRLVQTSRRALPVRWRTTPVIDQGRIA